MAFAWMAPSERKPPTPPSVTADAPATTMTSTRPVVLVVEDNWLVSLDLEAALTEAGYRVAGIAVSADEALSFCEAFRPDVTLMDIRLLGDRDGIDAAIEARQRFDIPTIFLSAHDDPQFRERAAEARPLGWLSKPLARDRLIAALEFLLAARQ